MIVLILAAGYGTRLYPLTENRPKALLPVGGRPILEHLARKLERLAPAPQKVILLSNQRYLKDFQSWAALSNPRRRWLILDDGTTSEENRLGSIGDFVFAIRNCSIDDDLLLLGSDNLFPDPLAPFLRFAEKKLPGVTVAVYELPSVELASRYGVLQVNPQDQVIDFKEKPKNPASRLVSTAVYFFPRRALPKVLEYAAVQEGQDTLGSFIRWLIHREEVYACRLRGPWFDIGDVGSYQNAQEHFSS